MILGVMGTLPGFFLDWFTIEKRWERAKFLTKPLALAILMGWFAIANFFRPHSEAVWEILILFFVGQALSLAGDIFLLLPGRYFLLGLLAFLAAHLAYTGSLQGWLAFPNPQFIVITLLVILAAAVYYRMLYRRMAASSRMRRLVFSTTVYVAAVSLMLISAASTLFQPDWRPSTAMITFFGGLFFIISDGLLAYDRFVRPLAHGRLMVRVLYHLGQLGLALGLSLQLWSTGV